MRLKVTKVKTAKSRSKSSAQWLQRQLNDPYVIQSKAEGYRSRAAYKLIEINEKFNLLRPNLNIVDLGAAPGGWSQVASKIMGSKAKIIAIDLLEMPAIENVHFMQRDFYEASTTEEIINSLNGNKADIILSDMAPNTTGHAATDHLRIMDLCERVFIFAQTILRPGGAMIIKIFQGGAQNNLLSQIKLKFNQTKHFKPKSSRSDSSEIYLVAMGFKG